MTTTEPHLIAYEMKLSDAMARAFLKDSTLRDHVVSIDDGRFHALVVPYDQAVAVNAALRKYSPLGEGFYASLCEGLARFAGSMRARMRRLEQDRDELIGAMEPFAEMATVGEDRQRAEGVALQPDDAPAAWPQTNGGMVECVLEWGRLRRARRIVEKMRSDQERMTPAPNAAINLLKRALPYVADMPTEEADELRAEILEVLKSAAPDDDAVSPGPTL